MSKNIATNVTKPLDTYLKFVLNSFNTRDSFHNLLDTLKNLAKHSNNKDVSKQATVLANKLNKIPILLEPAQYKKFDRLGNFNFGSAGLSEVYKVADDIIYDINTARSWLNEYKQFEAMNKSTNIQDLHKELIILGKSILARAVELCPMDTGFLRKSGILLDFNTHIIIAFTAPYASYVHENLAVSHPSHSSNPNCHGQAKFLERALQEFFPNKSVWVEHMGQEAVMCKISINPELIVEYTH